MSNRIVKILIFLGVICCLSFKLKAQNRSFIVNLSVGVGNSGFKVNNETKGELRRLFYPTGGLQLQKQLSTKWAINIYPNVGMSGNKRVLDTPVGNVTAVKSTSAFVNLGLHPKYYLNESIYCSLGPEISYLLWNYGSTFNGDIRLSNIKETASFNRFNFLISSSIGCSKKIQGSRKNAPVQIDALWYLEFRVKKGLSNVLNKDVFGSDLSSTIFSLELLTGISFASKK